LQEEEERAFDLRHEPLFFVASLDLAVLHQIDGFNLLRHPVFEEFEVLGD